MSACEVPLQVLALMAWFDSFQGHSMRGFLLSLPPSLRAALDCLNDETFAGVVSALVGAWNEWGNSPGDDARAAALVVRWIGHQGEAVVTALNRPAVNRLPNQYN